MSDLIAFVVVWTLFSIVMNAVKLLGNNPHIKDNDIIEKIMTVVWVLLTLPAYLGLLCLVLCLVLCLAAIHGKHTYTIQKVKT